MSLLGAEIVAKGSTAVSRRDDANGRKVAPVSLRIARQQGKPGDRRVSPDVEIRQRRTPRASSPPIFQESMAGEECRRPWQIDSLVVGPRECVIEFLDALPKTGVGKINKLALKARG